MKNKTILCLLLLLLSLHVYAQQRKRTTTQRRVMTTAVKKPAQPAVTKTREVGKDGFVWYKLKKGGLYGAADIEGKTIIPIKYSRVTYVDGQDDRHYFKVCKGDFDGIYTRRGKCIIPTDKHFTSCLLYCDKNKEGTPFLSVRCWTHDGPRALYAVRGTAVIPPGDSEYSYLSSGSEVTFVSYIQNGLQGAFDLNGNKLTRPCANSYVKVYKDRVEINNKINGEWKTSYIDGS